MSDTISSVLEEKLEKRDKELEALRKENARLQEHYEKDEDEDAEVDKIKKEIAEIQERIKKAHEEESSEEKAIKFEHKPEWTTKKLQDLVQKLVKDAVKNSAKTSQDKLCKQFDHEVEKSCKACNIN